MITIENQGLLDFSKARSVGELHLFTGNSYVRRDGALVMGRGAAQQVRDEHPGIDKLFGQAISHLGEYGTIVLPQYNIGVFQVKFHFRHDADLDLIERSAKTLGSWARAFDRAIYMNYPGVGNGKLSHEIVEPRLTPYLPDNVFCFIDQRPGAGWYGA